MKMVLAWLVALAIVWIAICKIDYYPNDGDGTLYTQLSEELAKKNLEEIIHVGWYQFNKIYGAESSAARYFYEHPPGYFVLPLFLSKLGFPAAKTTLLAEAFYQVILFFLFFLLVRKYFSEDVAQWTVLATLLIPVSFLYVLRPLHEIPMLVLTFAAIYAATFLKERPVVAWVSLVILAGVAALFKGIMIIPMLLITVSAGIVLSVPKRRIVNGALIFLAIGFGAYASLTIFDQYRMNLINDSFWRQYLQIQFWDRALENSTLVSVVVRSVKNLLFYTGTAVYYSQPWSSIAALVIVNKSFKRNRFSPQQFKFVLMLLVAAFFASMPMVVFARTSLRYIFPTFYFLAIAAFLVVFFRYETQFKAATERLNRIQPIFIAAGFWMVTRILALVFVTT